MLKGTHSEIERIGNRKFRLTQHLAPIAYHDGQGQLQRITNALGEKGNPTFPLGVDELCQFRIRSKLTGDAPVVYFGKGKSNVRFTPLGTNNVDGVISGQAITFPEAWRNADLRLTIAGHRLQKDILLRTGHPQSFSFRIDDHAGFDPNTLATADFRLLQPNLRNPATNLHEPLVWIVSEQGGKTILTVHLPPGDHAGKILDPTLTLSLASTDTHLVSNEADTNFGAATYFYMGETGGNTFRILIQFDLSGLPSSAAITSAIFSLYKNASDPVNDTTYKVYLLTQSWTEGGSTWNKYDGASVWPGGAGAYGDVGAEIGSLLIADDEGAGFVNWSLTPTTKTGLDSGDGWLVKSNTESDDRIFFDSSESTDTAERPKLAVEYTLPFIPRMMVF